MLLFMLCKTAFCFILLSKNYDIVYPSPAVPAVKFAFTVSYRVSSVLNIQLKTVPLCVEANPEFKRLNWLNPGPKAKHSQT